LGDLTRAQEQVLIAVLEIYRRTRGKKAPDQELLNSSANSIFEDELLDWAGVPEQLQANGFLEEKAGRYFLTESGLTRAQELYRDFFSRNFDSLLVQCAQSPTYSIFCERVYGRDLCQFNSAGMDQLDELLEVLGLHESDRVLDLGCGAGKISEYIADTTGAHVTAVDYAPGAIELARKRTESKRDRLTFELGDLDRLEQIPGPFDAVVAVDVLYFAVFVDRTLSQLKRLIEPHGQMGALFSQIIPPGGSRDRLLPGNTVLAGELSQQGLSFVTRDISDRDLDFWQRTLDTARDLREAFEAEGNLEIFESRHDEAQQMVEVVRDDRTRSYIYHVRL